MMGERYNEPKFTPAVAAVRDLIELIHELEAKLASLKEELEDVRRMVSAE